MSTTPRVARIHHASRSSLLVETNAWLPPCAGPLSGRESKRKKQTCLFVRSKKRKERHASRGRRIRRVHARREVVLGARQGHRRHQRSSLADTWFRWRERWSPSPSCVGLLPRSSRASQRRRQHLSRRLRRRSTPKLTTSPHRCRRRKSRSKVRLLLADFDS